ncbi:transcriptional regulator [Campylobacter fetus]|nr:transcriptional regulator [Campylobacter fetus]EJU9540810.1 transcriptional regulator [Campylobacter fetus]
MERKLSKRDMAGILKIDVKTLYNWKKNKPELYRIVMLGFKFDELLWLSKQNFEEMQKLARENQNYRLRYLLIAN